MIRVAHPVVEYSWDALTRKFAYDVSRMVKATGLYSVSKESLNHLMKDKWIDYVMRN